MLTILTMTALLGACSSTTSSAAPTAATSAAPTAATSAAPGEPTAAVSLDCPGGEYKIGANVGLTSWLAPYDTPALDGLKLAVDEINAQGGIGGSCKIVLSIKDNRSDSAEAAKAAQELVDEGVDFMIMPGDASMAIPAGKVGQPAGVPMMSFLASSCEQRPAVGDFYFSGGQADTLSGAGAAKYLRSAGYDTAYTLTSPDSAWLLLYPAYFQESWEKLGGTIAGTDEFRVGTQDFSATIAKIKSLSEPPDVILTAMYEPEWPAFIRQLRASGIETPVMASDAIDTQATLELGEAVDGVRAVTNGFPSAGDKLDQFYDHYQQATGERPRAVFPAVGYDLMYLIASAVEAAGTTDRTAVRDAIEATEAFDGVLGQTQFGIIEGFPVRPLTVQEWVTDDSGTVTIEKLGTVDVESDEIPACQGETG